MSPPKNKTIPFDYTFQFELTGVAQHRVQDVVEISMQGVFVAVAIGYSVVPKAEAISFPPVIDHTTTQNPHLVPFFNAERQLNGLLVGGMPGAEITILRFIPPDIQKSEVDVRPDGSVAVEPDGSINVDLVNLPTTPASGKSDKLPLGGDGTVIVNLDPLAGGFLRIWDRTNNLLNELVSLGSLGIIESGTDFRGFLAVTPSGTGFVAVTPVIGFNSISGRTPAAGDTVVDVYGPPNDRVELFLFQNANGRFSPVQGGPFDLVEETLSGRTTGHKQIELKLGTATTPTPLAPGDVLFVQTQSTTQTLIPFSMFTIPNPRLSTITLAALAGGAERINTDLRCGIRLNPNLASFFAPDFALAQLPPGDINRLFETCCSNVDDVSFLYSIDILSTGRELQNEPIHNVAGLGIANGDRPFRPLARPIAFEPRTFIRITVEELSGPPGTLYIVLHGYKTLGTGRIPD